MTKAMLDKSRPYGEVFGGDYPFKYTQDGNLYRPNGELLEEDNTAAIIIADRASAIGKAIDAIVADGNRSLFTARGKPKLSFVQDKVGFEVTPQELNNIWTQRQ